MTFSQNGVVWNVTLSDQEVVNADWAAGAVALHWPNEVTAALAAAAGYLLLMDKIGGSNGVDVTGVIGATGVVATTPHGAGFYNTLTSAANGVVAVGPINQMNIRRHHAAER
jgi:hypothetical protein